MTFYLKVIYSVIPLLLRIWNAFWPFQDYYLLGFVFAQFFYCLKLPCIKIHKRISANKTPLFHSRLGSPASFFSSTPVPRSRSTKIMTALSSISTFLLFVPVARAAWAPRRGAAAPPPLTHRFGSCFPGILFFKGVPGVLNFLPGLVSGIDSVAFRRCLAGYFAISGVDRELGAQRIPRTLMPGGGRRGRRTRSRCQGPSRSSAKHALWDSRQLPLILIIGWELGYR